MDLYVYHCYACIDEELTACVDLSSFVFRHKTADNTVFSP